MFEQAFKNIDNALREDAGISGELDYVEQTSWLLFLKYLDDLEKNKDVEARLKGTNYSRIIEPKFQWSNWAAPKDASGKLDDNKAITGDDLKSFVDNELFPYLRKFKYSAASTDTIEYKIGEIFSELKNKIESGYTLRSVINIVDSLEFRTKEQMHEMSHLYEARIHRMGQGGKNAGEYYTTRPLIKAIVKVVDPKIGETIYDGAVGSAGFLIEAYNHLLSENPDRSVQSEEILQKKTLYGKEKKPLPYIIGIMNMILHGIVTPNITKTNTLAENIADYEEKDRFDIVLANPPFGGKERKEVQQNFPIKTGETAFLFLQHFVKILKAGGRAGIVIKNTFLSNTDNASISLRKLLLESCNLHTILDLPSGVFSGAGVKTVVLFFEKGASTKKIWYYQLNLNRNLGKTNPLNEKDLEEFIKLQRTKDGSDNSWSLDMKDVNSSTWDLSVKNPVKDMEIELRDPENILKDIEAVDLEVSKIFKEIRNNL